MIMQFCHQFFYGSAAVSDTYFISSRLFYRGLGLVFFCAFLSLLVQIDGLYLSQGILPLKAVTSHAVTLFRFSQSDFFITSLVWIGSVVSFVLILGFYPVICVGILWSIYLSFVLVGQVFMNFQWDALLLEVSFLSLFLYPLFSSHVSKLDGRSPLFHFLLKLLLWRILFFSGFVKLKSGDVLWSSWRALDVHFYTQPIPHVGGWFAHQLPSAIKRVMTGGMFMIELIVPFFLFFPRRLRHGAVYLILVLMCSIMATGNYGFFNILMCVLAMLMLSDQSILKRFFSNTITYPIKRNQTRWISMCVGIFLLSCVSLFEGGRVYPFPQISSLNWVRSYSLINSYGLFAVMTKTRQELEFQGSYDGKSWTSYTFKYKPNDESECPNVVFPHQPRLDWQLWFVALRPYKSSPWIYAFVTGLLEGRDSVLGLLADNPFKSHPPMYVRVMAHDRVFTTMEERKQTGKWWKTTYSDEFTPVFELRR